MTKKDRVEVQNIVNDALIKVSEEFRHHTGALLDGFRDELRVTNNMVAALSEKLDRETGEIKQQIQTINYKLDRKADQSIVSDHEKRIGVLEQ